MGTAHSSIVPYRAYKTRDGHMIVGALNNGQFERMCDLLQRPLLPKDERFHSNATRVAHRKELDEIIEGELQRQDVSHWLREFEKARVPCGPINNLKQTFEDPQIVHRRMVQHMAHKGAGTVPLISPPVRFDDEQSPIRRAPPVLGQDTDAVLTTELGYSQAQLDELRVCGAIK